MWSIFKALTETCYRSPLLSDTNPLEGFHNGFAAWAPSHPQIKAFLKAIKTQQAVNEAKLSEQEGILYNL
jgi:hypothetical protein